MLQALPQSCMNSKLYLHQLIVEYIYCKCLYALIGGKGQSRHPYQDLKNNSEIEVIGVASLPQALKLVFN